jgi:hypothetical protein
LGLVAVPALAVEEPLPVLALVFDWAAELKEVSKLPLSAEPFGRSHLDQ